MAMRHHARRSYSTTGSSSVARVLYSSPESDQDEERLFCFTPAGVLTDHGCFIHSHIADACGSASAAVCHSGQAMTNNRILIVISHSTLAPNMVLLIRVVPGIWWITAVGPYSRRGLWKCSDIWPIICWQHSWSPETCMEIKLGPTMTKLPPR